MENRKHIAIIVESIDVDDSSGSKANVALIQNLKTIGYDTSVFHYTRKEIQLKDIPCFSIKEKKRGLYFLSRLQRVIQRTFKINFSKQLENIFGFSFTFFNDVNSIKSLISAKVDDYDLILTLSKGASFRSHYAVLNSPKLYDKWLAYVHDPYPFHCYPKPYDWFEPGYKQKEVFFKHVSEKARFSGFPSQLLKEWMGGFFPNFLETGIVIPHQSFKVDITSAKLPNYFDKKKFSLLHSGNLMMPRSPKGLIEGYKLFLASNNNAKFDSQLLMLGGSGYHKKLMEGYNRTIEQLYMSDGYVNFDVTYKLQHEVSVNIILEAKSEISPFLPGKFPHCISANKLILLLGPLKSETGRLLGIKYKYKAEIDDSIKIASLIEELYCNWKNNNNELLNRKDLEGYLSIEKLKEQIDALLIQSKTLNKVF